MLDAAFIGFNFAKQHLDKSCFSYAVRPNEGDPVAAHHGEVEPLHDALSGVFFAQAEGLDTVEALTTALSKQQDKLKQLEQQADAAGEV